VYKVHEFDSARFLQKFIWIIKLLRPV